MQKITPFLWFNDQAEEAVKFYASVFKKSKILKIARYGEAGERASGRPKNSVMTIEFELEGQKFVALNGGPLFKFNVPLPPLLSFIAMPAVPLVITPVPPASVPRLNIAVPVLSGTKMRNVAGMLNVPPTMVATPLPELLSPPSEK